MEDQNRETKVLNTATANLINNLVQAGHIDNVNLNEETRGITIPESFLAISRHLSGFTEVVGRAGLLSRIDANFDRSRREPTATPAIQVLHGISGVGKTSLARAFARSHATQYQIIWWIHAENLVTIPNEFRKLLEILSPDQARWITDPIHAAFAAFASAPGRWLLLFDNVVDAYGFTSLLPTVGPGDIIITTRSGEWPRSWHRIEVTSLKREDSVEVLMSLSNDDDRATAETVAEELGDLPLALAQAGAFSSAHRMALREYIDLYHQNRLAVLASGRAPDYDGSVTVAWNLAHERLSPSAKDVFDFCAWLTPDDIPVFEILRANVDSGIHGPVTEALEQLIHDPLMLRKACAELDRSGLLSWHSALTVSVHRLLHALARDHLESTGLASAWAGNTAALLLAACPTAFADREAIDTWLRLEPHALTIVGHLPTDDITSLRLRVRIAAWTGYLGADATAKAMLTDLVIDYQRVRGGDDPETLGVRSNLAWWIGGTGDPHDARDRYAVIVTDLERISGPDHPQTLQTRDSLAKWTGELGEVVSARNLYASLAEDAAQVLGDEHVTTLQARIGLARWVGEAGDPASARDMYADLLPVHERVMGARHKDSLYIRACLAWWTGEAGDARSACSLYAVVLTDCEDILGKDSRDTLGTRHGWAHWLGQAGDIAEAKAHFAALVEDHIRIKGVDHQDTRHAQRELDRWSTVLDTEPR
ncbi:FxSxx-COOH system tetratricopeptide repeat protein [Lentzea sp. NPDC005914]|uniref:FxSxx-COOH system tetratricopeptide repeat protein n=1 Tax=Lentzea sp. NPDC005914 TaxID=3154572 RepID=UPI0033E59822